MKRLPGVDTGATVHAVAHASFRGSASATNRSWLGSSSARARAESYDAWKATANAAGFPTAGADMVLAVVDDDLVVFRTTFVLSRPTEIAGRLPRTRIIDAVAVRHGLVVGLALVVDNGTVVEVESMRGRSLRAIAELLRTR